MGATNHKTIITTIETINHKQARLITNRKKLYHELKQMEIEEHTSVKQIFQKIDTLVKENTSKSKKPLKIWWNRETEKAWKVKNKSRQIFNRNKTIENEIEFKKNLAKFRLIKRKHKIQKYEEKLSEINNYTNTTELWRFIGKIEGKKTNTKDENLIHNNKEAAKTFLEENFQKNKKGNKKPYQYARPLNNIMDEERWHNILKKKKNTAPGPDKISYEILKNINRPSVSKIVKEINNMWEKGNLKKKYKHIEIVAIPKPGADRNNAKNYRPIAMIPAITKIINSAVLEDLNRHCHNNNIIPTTSFGFKKNCTTNQCVNYLVNEITSNKRKNWLTGIMFIDLKSAYNNVHTDSLIQILEQNQIPIEIIRWVGSFLNNRTIEIKSEGEKLKKLVSDGLPQGDVLSPTLFNIYTKKIHETLNNSDGKVLQYADDFVIIQKGKTATELEYKMQTAINSFSNTIQGLKLPINIDKTKFMIFSKKPQNITIQIRNQRIEKVTVYKYLGVWIDGNLFFKKHVEELKDKARKRLQLVRRICNTKNNLSPTKTITVHRAIIRNILETGSLYTLNAKKNLLNSMNSITNQSLRKVTGCSKTTPINTLMAIAAETPPHIRASYIAKKDMVKTLIYSPIHRDQMRRTMRENSRTRSRNKSYMENLFQNNLNIFEETARIKTNDINGSTKIRCEIEPNISKNSTAGKVYLKQFCEQEIKKLGTTNTLIFTDGSKSDEGCGIGIYIRPHNNNNNRYWAHKFKTKNITPITSIELAAIEKAINIITIEKIENPIILTDSQAACKILINAQNLDHIDEIVYNILRGCKHSNAQIRWIPGHLGLYGNEKADELAKKGVHAKDIYNNKLRLADVNHMLVENMKKETREWYKKTCEQKGKKFQRFQKEFEDKPWHHNLNITPHDIKTTNKIIAGHDLSKYWLNKMRITENGNCDACNIPETGTHNIFYCNRYQTQREKYDISFDAFLEKWKEPNGRMVKNITKFIRETKISL
ncbi:uncharacterized protein LOC118512062 isoform X2 [Anopheles stephensi]|nr:uncharacterized protein LOC118512062 isoform X2 [Anopheles stephensi]